MVHSYPLTELDEDLLRKNQKESTDSQKESSSSSQNNDEEDQTNEQTDQNTLNGERAVSKSTIQQSGQW